MNETIQSILARKSVRKYEATPLTEEELKLLLKCADMAPSAANRQSTKIVATQNPELIGEVVTAFEHPFNYDAPCLIFLYSGEVGGERWRAFNAALAAENISIAAVAMGLATVQLGCIYDLMNGEKGEIFKEKLGIPADYRFELAISVGHGAEDPEPRKRNEGNTAIV